MHFLSEVAGAAAVLLLAAAPLSSAHAAAPAPAPVAPQPAAGQSVDDFYRARNGAPLWLAPAAGDAAEQLLTLLSTASLDGLDPTVPCRRTATGARRRRAAASPRTSSAPTRALSDAFVAYVRDLRRDPGLGIFYVDAGPEAVTAFAAARR